ncbi:unnamed protein product [Miscanthus lutarioriparius]|uniref:Uncharacterized protein n=1 Tax=Miscanthus lutarioriparius TaxID=422564 RepID=A0A811R066_9POAL|nr:unnamed protein product [Miscanthus lutarioriparius]
MAASDSSVGPRRRGSQLPPATNFVVPSSSPGPAIYRRRKAVGRGKYLRLPADSRRKAVGREKYLRLPAVALVRQRREPHLSASSFSSSTWMGDSQSANLSSGKDRKIGSHHPRVKTRLQRCSHVTSREPRRIVVTGIQLRTGSQRTHRRTPHPHSGQCGRATELRAARCEEAEEEAREQQLYRGLNDAGASSSPAASSAHVRAAAPPRPHGHACEQLRRVLASARRGRPRWWLTRWGARMGSCCSDELGVKAVPSLWCVPHPDAGRWSSGHGRWSSDELSPIQGF